MGLIALFLLEAIAAGVGIRLLAAFDAFACAVPTLLHIGGMEHQSTTTVVYPHLEFGNTHTDGGETVVDIPIGREYIGEVNGSLFDGNRLA